MSSGRVGKAINLTCFFTACYGRHRSQWVKPTALKIAVKSEFFLFSKSKSSAFMHHKLMKNIGMSPDWLRVALLLNEISRSIGLFGTVCKTNKLTPRNVHS